MCGFNEGGDFLPFSNISSKEQTTIDEVFFKTKSNLGDDDDDDDDC
jgi:hypothetical protein